MEIKKLPLFRIEEYDLISLFKLTMPCLHIEPKVVQVLVIPGDVENGA